jgi:hypothetical protein
MGAPKDYAPESLIEAVTGRDWNTEHVKLAMKATQEKVLENFGDEPSDPPTASIVAKPSDAILLPALCEGRRHRGRPRHANPLLQSGGCIGNGRAESDSPEG